MLILGGAPSASSSRAGTGTAAGTCGELVQGFTGTGQPFHVSCPIDKSSTISVSVRRAKETTVTQLAEGFNKIELALLRTADLLDLEPCEIRVARWTDLEVGKGLGSSTADIVASARALANAVGKILNATQLASIATSIESSDGSMHEGIVAFDQKSGALLRRYEWWPQFAIVMLVPSKVFNTESANFGNKTNLGPKFDELLDQIDEAVIRRDVLGFAQAATASSQMNQKYVLNPHFSLAHERMSDFGAQGINVAHTGTMMGLLFDASEGACSKSASNAAVELQHMFPETRVEIALTPPSPSV